MRARATIITFAVCAALAAAAVTAAGAASAAPNPLPSVRAVTVIEDRPDSGNGGTWADDSLIRTITITRTGGTPGAYTFTASLGDIGTFTTIKGALTPNQGVPYTGDVIKSVVRDGLVTGSAQFTFTASRLPASGFNAGVPVYEDDHGNTPADSTSAWYELAFPAGTVFGGTGIGRWSWTYGAWVPSGHQQWIDSSSNADGNLPGDGNISG